MVPADSDYPKRKGEVIDAQLNAIVKRMKGETARDRKAGRRTRFTQDLKAAPRD